MWRGARDDRGRGVVHCQHDLAERVAPDVPLGPQLLDEPVEGQLLIGIGGEHGLPHLPHERGEAEQSRQSNAQHEGVDEEPDQSLELGPVAAGDGRADRQIDLPGVTVEQRTETGQQNHERRGVVLPCERLDAVAQRRPKVEMAPPPFHAPARGPRPVRRQFGQRHVGQVLGPVAELVPVLLRAQPFKLPDRVVGVLDRQLGQRGVATRRESSVDRRQLLRQHAHGPAVGHDVMHDDDQEFVALREMQEPRTPERPAREVEGHAEIRFGQP